MQYSVHIIQPFSCKVELEYGIFFYCVLYHSIKYDFEHHAFHIVQPIFRKADRRTSKPISLHVLIGFDVRLFLYSHLGRRVFTLSLSSQQM